MTLQRKLRSSQKVLASEIFTDSDTFQGADSRKRKIFTEISLLASRK